jgi:hypothetical protein
MRAGSKVREPMGFPNRAICAGGLGFAVSALVACGSSGSLLSPGEAGQLNGQLAQVSQALSASNCPAAASAVQSFQNSVGNLSGVNGTLVSN